MTSRGAVIVGTLLWMLTAGAAAAHAHDADDLDVWRHEWTQTVLNQGGLTPGLVDVWRDMADRHGCSWPGVTCLIVAPETRQVTPPQTVEGWRPLVAAHFPADRVDAALSVMACESGGDQYAANPHSTARGLFQFVSGWWSGAWGYPAFDPYHAEANVRAAAWLSDGGADWSHWVCRP